MSAPPRPADAVAALAALRTSEVPLLLAVSGGGDSMALLHAAANARARFGSFPALHAVTVDHGLRRESVEEARFVAERCSGLGIPHETVRLEWSVSPSGVQAAARRARLRALREAALNRNGATILTAHTADDDAETAAMRAERDRGDRPSEWAGIAPALWLQPGWLFRPFLSRRREALRSYLRAETAEWIEDPSNLDRSFERVRVRAALGEVEGRGARFVRLAAECSDARKDLAAGAAVVLRERFSPAAEGFALHLCGSAALADAGSAGRLAMRVACAHVGGLRQMPAPDGIDRAIETVRPSGPWGEERRMSVARCLVAPDRRERHRGDLFIAPDPRERVGPMIVGRRVRQGERGAPPARSRRVAAERWGGTLHHGVFLPPDGDPGGRQLMDGPAMLSRERRHDARTAWQAVPDAPPVPLRAETLDGGRTLSAGPLARALTPYVEFVPSHDLALGRALAEIVGAGHPLSPPPVPAAFAMALASGR